MAEGFQWPMELFWLTGLLAILAVALAGYIWRPQGRRAVVRVGVSHKSDPDRVIDTLVRAAGECPGIAREPPPQASFDNFSPHALEFSVSAAVAGGSTRGAAETDLRTRILKAFRAADIEIAHAQHDVHLRDLDMVRMILSRIAEERARAAEAPAGGPRKPAPDIPAGADRK
jgi:small-conductance mechanosensitive channel